MVATPKSRPAYDAAYEAPAWELQLAHADAGELEKNREAESMLKLMFVLLTAIDILAINAFLEQTSPEATQLGLMWLFYYSSLIGWLIGAKAWQECKINAGSSLTLIRLCTANSMVFAAVAAALNYSGKDPQEWLGLYLYMGVYLFRLGPLAAASIVLTPFLCLSARRPGAILAVVICQACAWWGAHLTLGQDPTWKESFLMFGLWIPNWGFGLMTGGLLLKPILSRPESQPASSQSPTEAP